MTANRVRVSCESSIWRDLKGKVLDYKGSLARVALDDGPVKFFRLEALEFIPTESQTVNDTDYLTKFLDALFLWVEGKVTNPAVLLALQFVNHGADAMVPELLAYLNGLGITSLTAAPSVVVIAIFDFLVARYPFAGVALIVARNVLLAQAPGLLQQLFGYVASLASGPVVAVDAASGLPIIDAEVAEPIWRARQARANPVAC